MASCLCSDRNCPKSGPQTNLGTSYLSEKSPIFYKNPREFFKKYLNEDRVFVCRFAMKPCFVLASHPLVKELLDKTDEETYNGLQDFFFGLFGNNIMFADGAQSIQLRRILMPLMDFDRYQSDLEELVDRCIVREFTTNDPIIAYDKFKRFATILSLRLFLNMDDPEAEQVSKLATTHWHGIISVPLNVKLSFLMSSSYRKALEAKDTLLSLIEKKLEAQDSDFLKSAFEAVSDNQETVDMELLKNTILLFVCALIPKALASILNTFVDTSILWREKFCDEHGNLSKENLSNIFSEIIRLWPPFFGGLRVTKKEITLGNFHIPEGYGIFYANFLAHRDPAVFEDPEEFKPERWTDPELSKDNLFGFGSGTHRCIGENLMLDVMNHVGKKLVEKFTWEDLENPMEQDIKCLPVLRPRQLRPIVMKRK